MQNYSRELAEELKDTAFLERFLEVYFRNGFGSLPKREIDLMLLELAIAHAPSWRETLPPTYELARNLRISPRRLRSMLDQVAYRDESKGDDWCRERLIEALRSAEKIRDGAMVQLQIDDGLVRDYAIAKVRRGFGVVDSSFNSAVIKLSGEKFAALTLELFEKEQAAVLSTISPDDRRARQDSRGSKGPVRLFVDAFVGKLGGMAAETLVSVAFDLLAGSPLSAAKTAARALSSSGQAALRPVA